MAPKISITSKNKTKIIAIEIKNDRNENMENNTNKTILTTKD